MRSRRRPPTPVPADPDCGHVAAVLQSYLDGELGPGDAEAVAGHLEHCQRCGIEEAVTRKVIGAIQRQRPDLDAEPLERLAGFVERLTHEDPSA